MTRRRRVDSAAAGVVIMQSAAREILPPDCEPLDDGDWPFWDAVVRARAKAEWAEENLIVAAKLARAMSDESRIVRELRKESDIVLNLRGSPVVNPKHALVEQLARRVMAWRKALALDARGADGRASDIARRTQISKGIEADNPLDDELLARPSIQ